MYRAVIIGAGKIASGFDDPHSPDILTHAHACQILPSFQLMGFYDNDYQKGLEAADKWGCQAYETLEAALKEAEMVFCCVPDRFHKQVLEEISAYRPRLVIAEKPLAATAAEGEQLRRIYARRIPLLLNYSRRFLREFQELRNEVGQYGRFLKGVGYYGKGTLHNGSHMIDLLRFLFGTVECSNILPGVIFDLEEDPSRDFVLKVQGESFYMFAVDSRTVTVFELELFFEKARIRILDGGFLIETYRVKESETYQGYYNYVLAERKKVNYNHAIVGLLENAEGVLAGREDPLCSLEDGLCVLQLCMQIRGEPL